MHVLSILALCILISRQSQSTYVGPIVAISDVVTILPVEGIQLMCIALGNVSVNWSKNESHSSIPPTRQVFSDSFDYDGRLYHFSILKLCSPLTSADEGTYTCSIASASENTEEGTLLKLKWKYVEIARSDIEDGNTVLNCSANGFYEDTVQSFTWTKNNNFYSNSSVLNLPYTEFGNYSCTISSKDTNMTYYTVMDKITPLHIIDITGATTEVGGNATLVCRGRGVKKSDLIINWTNSEGQVLTSEEETIDGIITSTLEFLNTTESVLDYYNCILTDGISSINSSIFLNITQPENTHENVTHEEEISTESPNPIVSIQVTEVTTKYTGGNLVVFPGDSVELLCKGRAQNSMANLTVIWLKNSVRIHQDYSYELTQNDGLQTISSTLNVIDLQSSSNIKYTCKVESGNHSAESDMILTVGPDYDNLEVVILSNNAVTDLGTGVLFTCMVLSPNLSSSIEISWIHSKTKEGLTSTGSYCIDDRTFIQGEYLFKQSFLQITGLMCEHAGTYICSATDGNVNLTYPVELYLKELPEVVVSSQVVNSVVGDDARLVCVAYSIINQTFNFTWLSDHVTISNSSGTIIKESQFTLRNRTYVMSVLHRCNDSIPLSLDDNSEFECKAVGKCDGSAVIDLVVLEKPLLIQIKLYIPSASCQDLKGPVERKEITGILVDVLRERCSECDLDREETVTNGTLLCYEKLPGFIIYRALLHGTRYVSVNKLVQDLEAWVETNPFIAVKDIPLNVQSTCPVQIFSFNDPPCIDQTTGEPQSSTPLKLEIVSGIILTVLFAVGLMVAVIVIFLLRRKAKLAKENAVYNYVDIYQYQMYYEQEGLYEDLNDYEPIGGNIENYQRKNYDIGHRSGDRSKDGYYEPINGGIYDVSPNVAYTSGKGYTNVTQKVFGGGIYDLSPNVAYAPGQRGYADKSGIYCINPNVAYEKSAVTENKSYANIPDKISNKGNNGEHPYHTISPVFVCENMQKEDSYDTIDKESSYEEVRERNQYEMIGKESLPVSGENPEGTSTSETHDTNTETGGL